MDHARRLKLAREIAERIRLHYGDRVLAIGVYGSVARGTDGPYSDTELFCVLSETGVDHVHEWSTGPWKAEVNVFGADVLLRRAAEVDVDWPISHGAVVVVLPLYDPTGFFARLRETVLSQPDEAFRRALREVIVGELYERIGKIRNARAAGRSAGMTLLITQFTRDCACLIALARRHLYTTAPNCLEESLALPGRPAGYDALCRMVMAGDLADPARCANAADAVWAGIEQWARERGILMEEDIDGLLSSQPT